MPEILIAEEHDQLYEIWVERGERNLAVTHVDFHCDMRGLMVDRTHRRAHWISRHEASFVDPGNFLGHAIMQGMVRSVKWIHDPHGGRLHDDGGVVKYESDVLAQPRQWAHRLSRGDEATVELEELYFEHWDNQLEPGEVLDIDWDAIASKEYDAAKIRHLIDSFLARQFSVIPDTTFLVFSPDYSIPDRQLFETFAQRLADKFSAEIVRLPRPTMAPASKMPPRSLPMRVAGTVRRHIPQSLKRAKRGVSFRLRAIATRHDVQSDVR
ncbi:MAG: hypothetical protein NXI27_20970 [Alphaproteobacteria bacterium]|nr:hypothetical protein [Alphaproteobacteria bacterium]